ncbi:anti-sigma regulatory factor (Ser/Thr protein kinase) [Streptomyces umbrinus]|uniref:Anti-sigma regulatory factor (Ser/Thr protein kinase) n=1 Tax=Streptomyces umbrinus TaxID=67370 RepID=A0ABU0SZT7_9ACTN|nr:ATP-binding protein [Streptomyces umbrinus]MDQ1029072.1 anti-sigma regulatory factor (Ser/Thr protein kinase) [Streptomyces umbrinus]
MNKERSTQLDTPTRHFSVLLSPTPRGARLARLLGAEWLRTWDLPYGVTETAEHLVAELAANAATHGRLPGRDFRLALLARGETLRIEVTDTRGDDLPRHRHPSPDTESGRGLLLVEALADRWGVELGPVPRKTVWAELDLAPHSPEPEGVCSGGSGALPKETRGGKKPHQAPPLPPTAGAHSGE